MITLNRVNLKDPRTVGFLQRWYGFDTGNEELVWTSIPEPGRPADLDVVVETLCQDDFMVRACLRAAFPTYRKAVEVAP